MYSMAITCHGFQHSETNKVKVPNVCTESMCRLYVLKTMSVFCHWICHWLSIIWYGLEQQIVDKTNC